MHDRLAKLDESTDYRRLGSLLRRAGFKVETVDDEGLKGAADDVIVARADQEEAVLFTRDPDMTDLRRWRLRRNCIVVLLRPGRHGNRVLFETLEQLLLEQQIPTLAGTTVIVEPGRWRVMLPRTEGGTILNIVVCIKQVPETDEVRIAPETKTLVREGVPMILNPLDEHALEAALQLKESQGAHVTAISMGPPSAEQVLRHALGMGCDAAVLISDRALAGSDTLATARALAAAIRKLGAVDLVLCGDHSADGDTGQVGPELAELLGVNQATFAIALAHEGDALQVRRSLTGVVETVRVPLPALVTVLKDIGKPRRPGLRGLRAARKAEIPTWSLADLGLGVELVGLGGSPTQVVDLRKPPPRGGTQKYEVPVEEAAAQIAGLLSGEVVG